MADTEKLIESLESSGLDIHGIHMIHQGKTVLHHAFDDDKPYPIYSAAKSVTALAFALAWDDKAVAPEMAVVPFLDGGYEFPEGFKELTFERLLTMTAGKFPFRPQGDDWLRYILSADVDYSDRSFNYSNIPAYLVGAACENAVGQSLMEFLTKRLFEPLGIAAPKYSTCPHGHFYGATGMEMSVEDLAKLGQLCLDGGSYNGRQLISSRSISQAVSPHVPAGDDSYGYFFRAAGDHFSMVGKWGQRCMVFPQRQLVAAYLADCPDDAQRLYELVYSCITGTTLGHNR